MLLTLTRELMTKAASVGALDVAGRGILYTLERPWVPHETQLFGTPSVSCLPEGRYQLVPAFSPTFSGRFGGRPMFYVTQGSAVTVRPVAGCARWGILIHPANLPTQLAGCIAPGKGRGPGGAYITHSTAALDLLHGWLDADAGPHTLTIKNGRNAWREN